MKTHYTFSALFAVMFLFLQAPDAVDIIRKVDNNIRSENKYVTSTMVIHSRRTTREVTSRSWLRGEHESFSEYLSPARERGTKMLKLEDNLWMYSPSTDRIIRISGHMLKQSVMGSDLTYEDMMEDPSLLNHYDPEIIGSKMFMGRDCWEIQLKAKNISVSYDKRILLVDKERFIYLEDRRFGKSGRLLRKVSIKHVKNIGGRWVATHVIYKDMLKEGKGTEFIINDIKFNVDIPPYRFSKAALKR